MLLIKHSNNNNGLLALGVREFVAAATGALVIHYS
jgi:hypothetical protein